MLALLALRAHEGFQQALLRGAKLGENNGRLRKTRPLDCATQESYVRVASWWSWNPVRGRNVAATADFQRASCLSSRFQQGRNDVPGALWDAFYRGDPMETRGSAFRPISARNATQDKSATRSLPTRRRHACVSFWFNHCSTRRYSTDIARCVAMSAQRCHH